MNEFTGATSNNANDSPNGRLTAMETSPECQLVMDRISTLRSLNVAGPGRSSIFLFTALSLLAMSGPRLLAQLPHAQISYLYPPGGKQGTEVQVTVGGVNLDEGRALVFSHPNIVCEPIAGQSTKYKLKIGADVPLGAHEVWFVGRFGMSNPRSFVVGQRAESVESGTHNSLTTASVIAIGTTVNARVEASASDYYKFTAKKGQRVLIECQAAAIDSRMKASLVLFDLEARELARSRKGGLIDFTAPADGDYVIKTHDFRFRGGADYFYRLTVHDGPRVDFALPAAGIAGTTSKHTLYGRNLPGGKPVADMTSNGGALQSLEVEIAAPKEASAMSRDGRPSSGGVVGFEYRLKTEKGFSNPVILGLANAPLVVEKEPNDQPAEAQKIAVPCELSGQFFRQRDQDWLSFDAKKGDSFWVEIVSERIGLATHPFVLIQRVTKDAKGVESAADVKELYETTTNLGGRSFNTYSRDFAYRLDVKDDGAYRILVRDLNNEADAQPDRVYRLSIRKAAPDFHLIAKADDPLPIAANTRPAVPWSATLRKGESIPVQAMAFRRDGFNDAIELSVEGLPKGVKAYNAVIPAGKSTGWVTLTAAKDAGDWAGTVKVVGSAKIGDAVVKREARGASVNWAVKDYNVTPIDSRVVAGVSLSVIGKEIVPVAIVADSVKIYEGVVGGKIEVPLKLARVATYAADLKVKLIGHTAFAKFKDTTIKGKDKESKFAVDLKAYKLPVGEHALYLRTLSKGKYRANPEAAAAATAASKAAVTAAKSAAGAVTKAKAAVAAADKAVKAAGAKSEDEKKKLAVAKATAEKALKTAEATAKAAEAKKTSTAAAAKSAEARAKAKDITATFYSTPIRVKVNAAPKK